MKCTSGYCNKAIALLVFVLSQGDWKYGQNNNGLTTGMGVWNDNVMNENITMEILIRFRSLTKM